MHQQNPKNAIQNQTYQTHDQMVPSFHLLSRFSLWNLWMMMTMLLLLLLLRLRLSFLLLLFHHTNNMYHHHHHNIEQWIQVNYRIQLLFLSLLSCCSDVLRAFWSKLVFLSFFLAYFYYHILLLVLPKATMCMKDWLQTYKITTK